jgi:hypothetical protein
MAFGVVHRFPGGTKEQYEASIAAVHPSHDTLPDGQIFHAAGPADGGWIITAVHESKESWQAFRDKILMPRMQAGIEGGFETPPQETEFEIYNLQSGGALEPASG